MAKYDYKTLNPQTIGDLSTREMRAAYSELRSIARKRADRLEAAGYEAMRFDPVDKVFSSDLEEELTELAYWLRSPGSRVSVARKEREQATLAAHGYSIENVDQFGKFMDDMRYRFRNRKLPDSGMFAEIYKQAERRKMSVRTLQREFGKYLNDAAEAEKLLEALEDAPMKTKGRDRLTAASLRSILENKR